MTSLWSGAGAIFRFWLGAVDCTGLWSGAGANIGADSEAGADSLFLLRFLSWLVVRVIAAVS